MKKKYFGAKIVYLCLQDPESHLIKEVFVLLVYGLRKKKLNWKKRQDNLKKF